MSKKIILKISEDDDLVAYLFLPKHPKKIISGIVKKSISISELIQNYKGIPINLDFDENDELIGIEIAG
jgi:hypothetical protein